MADIKLTDLTKVDLIWLINRIRRDPVGDFRVSRALLDLEERQEMARIDEADRQLGIVCDARMQSAELLRPYEGKCIADIPLSVCAQVDELEKKRKSAWQKYLRLTAEPK